MSGTHADEETAQHPDDALGKAFEQILHQLNVIISNLMCPNEDVDKCPDCGEPWWTVQKRCKCWPKPGTLEKELHDLEQQVAALYSMEDKPRIALSKLAKGEQP